MTTPLAAAPLQEPRDFWVGSVDAVDASRQVLTSQLFKDLPTYYSNDRVLPAQIVDENTGQHETVHIVGTSGTTTAVVKRGREGTDPQNWQNAATIRCSARTRDLVTTYTDANSVPTDLPVGSRYALDGERILRTQTRRQGGLGSMHCSPADMLRGIAAGAAIPAEYEPRMLVMPVGPIYTSAVGAVDIFWDGLGTNGNYWSWNVNLETRFQLVTGIFPCGYLTGGDAAWLGDMVAAVTGGNSCAVRCKTPSGAWFANRLVRFSLAVFGV